MSNNDDLGNLYEAMASGVPTEDQQLEEHTVHDYPLPVTPVERTTVTISAGKRDKVNYRIAGIEQGPEDIPLTLKGRKVGEKISVKDVDAMVRCGVKFKQIKSESAFDAKLAEHRQQLNDSKLHVNDKVKLCSNWKDHVSDPNVISKVQDWDKVSSEFRLADVPFDLPMSAYERVGPMETSMDLEIPRVEHPVEFGDAPAGDSYDKGKDWQGTNFGR